MGKLLPATDESNGRIAVVIESAPPPPVERPWWMRVHGDSDHSIPVTNLDEVWEQFLMDDDMRELERLCVQVRHGAEAAKNNAAAVVPGISDEEAGKLAAWADCIGKFRKVRQVAAEKHARLNEVRTRRAVGSGPSSSADAGAGDYSSAEDDEETSEVGSRLGTGSGAPPPLSPPSPRRSGKGPPTVRRRRSFSSASGDSAVEAHSPNSWQRKVLPAVQAALFIGRTKKLGGPEGSGTPSPRLVRVGASIFGSDKSGGSSSGAGAAGLAGGPGGVRNSRRPSVASQA